MRTRRWSICQFKKLIVLNGMRVAIVKYLNNETEVTLQI